jgi:hypothetical protein
MIKNPRAIGEITVKNDKFAAKFQSKNFLE